MNSDSNVELLSEQVPGHLAGKRLDQALAQMFPQYSRSKLKSWVLKGQVTVDGEVIRPKDAVASGSTIIVTPVAEVVVKSQPEAMDLEVAFEDTDLMVIVKPAGLVVHPGAGNHRGTLMNGLLAYAPQLEAIPRAGIVHRLDKDTSGLLLVAKTLEAHTALVRQLGEREISRHYLAVCNGVLTGGGKIDLPIGRHPVDRLRKHVTESGKPAVTHYRVLERFAAHTYISVQLETGRTHQIRVHFAHKRHALLPAGANEEVIDLLRRFKRQALHAETLSFAHPVSDKPVSIQADPPSDFQDMLQVLRRHS